MSDDPTKPTASQSTDDQKDNLDLVGELREMGQQLEAMFRAVIESDRVKQLRRDLSGGVKELTAQVQTALKTVQADPRVQQAEERGRQALSQAQQSKAVQDFQETLVNGITQINEQLRRAVDRLETERATPVSSSSSQQVPIDTDTSSTTPVAPTPLSDTPATSETTRLDDKN